MTRDMFKNIVENLNPYDKIRYDAWKNVWMKEWMKEWSMDSWMNGFMDE
jgi:hypothetical protein